jgi:Asp-tRNA(Asn)/Glu-tRNA(Gln) amidotransferase A subunit family amidase
MRRMKTWWIVFASLAAAAVLTAVTPKSVAQVPSDPAAPFEVMEASIGDIHTAYRAGALTARQLIQKYLDRIEAYDRRGPTINAIITLNPNALDDAGRIDEAYAASGFVGPLHGIAVLVKDEIDTVGMPTTMGTLVFKEYRPTRDAFVIEKLRAAGAIILGKTTLSEFAAGDTYGSMFGVTRNPYDLERTVGGSSGGSGASLAASFSTVALGEETFASIRRPGAWNAVVALRPTPGLVSRSGMWDGYPTLNAQMGPMARNIRDLAHLLDVMVGYDSEDPLTAAGVGMAEGSYLQALDEDGLRGARIGILREPIGNNSDPESDDFKKVDSAFQQSVAELRAAGAILVDPLEIPDLKELLAKRASDEIASDEALRRYLARNPNSPYRTREDIANAPALLEGYPRPRLDRWEIPLPVTEPAEYLEYLRARDQLMINILKMMADHRLDAIVHKTVEHQPNLIEDGINPPYLSARGVPALNTFLAYSAIITAPSGFTSDGLPVGITFFGRPYSEPLLLKLSYAYEQATHHRRPPATTPGLVDANLATNPSR